MIIKNGFEEEETFIVEIPWVYPIPGVTPSEPDEETMPMEPLEMPVEAPLEPELVPVGG